MTEIIRKYFPHLTPRQEEQIAALDTLYHDWNAKINVISRKDIDNLYEHHILHSLAIAKRIRFREGTNVLDFGTGGGFPGIPLAILFPESNFKLIDGTGNQGCPGNCRFHRPRECSPHSQTGRRGKGKVRFHRFAGCDASA